MKIITEGGRTAISTDEVASMLGNCSRGSAIAALRAARIKDIDAAKMRSGRGYLRFWPEAQVVNNLDRLQAIVEKNRRWGGGPAAPAVAHKLPDDDSLEVIRETLDGLKPYVCRLGDEQARSRAEADQHSARLRVLTIGMNRLLKAAGLQPVPETPGGSGEAQ